ncbi:MULTISPECIES: hypothetical protein [Pectobacterium]|uniref:Uncharacterized protein n=1 Tax=Pectobacterium parvum TaxID=2778550 RepID=A0AAP9IML5_9GAMM|nr:MULTISPECIES: hypothetical protein [Pectobacterium]MBA0188289.1 hypothetical protein [Pectobacterium odoriferum]QHQ25883.1 hypothetical protein GMX10_18990 [Pectobacterium parvum]UVD99364.1 hypothetical protein NV347_10435 [Pectobacterium parvum]GKV88479.1 hypothetical protein PEC301619_04610 [Pectobacterium carotovorum subsp. carotovorum]
MTIRSVKYIQYQHRIGSHNIHQNPQQKNGLIFLIVVIATAFSVLSLIL